MTHTPWPVILEDCSYTQLVRIEKKIRARGCSCANCESDLEVLDNTIGEIAEYESREISNSEFFESR